MNVWQALCSTGEQAYALAILLEEEELRHPARVYATDADEVALAWARRGRYPRASIREADYREAGGSSSLDRYFSFHGGEAQVLPYLRARLTFATHSLAGDASFNEFQLIVCLEPSGDSSSGVPSRAFEVFHESLCPFGILCLGAGASLDEHPRAACYEPFDVAHGLFRRIRR